MMELVVAAYEKDPSHWLRKLLPDEWIRAAMKEIRAAEMAYRTNQAKAGLAGCRRAAGMALNAALIVEPNDAWKRTYVEHLEAVAKDASVPVAVSGACRMLLDAQPPGPNLVMLRSPASNERLVEAARDVVAHAYAIVKRHEAKS